MQTPPPTARRRHHATQAGTKPAQIPLLSWSPQAPFPGTHPITEAGEASRTSTRSSPKSLPSAEVSVFRHRSLKQGTRLPALLF